MCVNAHPILTHLRPQTNGIMHVLYEQKQSLIFACEFSNLNLNKKRIKYITPKNQLTNTGVVFAKSHLCLIPRVFAKSYLMP